MFKYHLSTGTLTIQPHAGNWSPHALFEIAERRNPKRAFLFVSKALGRHIPVAPRTMKHAYRDLAQQIPAGLPGPVLFIGMAETAVGLAAGVHREYCRTRGDAVLITSTRHPVDGKLMCEFVEAHSHATDHLIYWPEDPELATMARYARSLVLVDDEATTGNTFANLLAELPKAGLSQLQRVCTVTLTDWSGNALAGKSPFPVTPIALMTGEWKWDPKPEAIPPVMPAVNVTARGTVPLSQRQDWGRLGAGAGSGCKAPPTARPALLGERILVLGSGEFVWPPFLLAEQLEQQGGEVKFSSITRSPIAVGMAISNALSFSDNYGLGIPNFAYNIHPEQYDRIIVCVETPADSLDPALCQSLRNVEVITYA